MNKNTVVIPTAGLGSRLGKLTQFLNKSLIPYKNKPILSHIIESFPTDTQFIIPIGYQSQQVIDYCKLVYPFLKIKFVIIDDYVSEKSGPGYTISRCFDILNSEFWYIPCDTYYNEDLTSFNLKHDTVFTKNVPTEMSEHYTMFKIQNNKVKDMTFKIQQTMDWEAFTGVMFIKDYVNFKHRLTSSHSNEIVFAIEKDTNQVNLNSWKDFGNLEIYNSEVKKTQKYDFTKTDEITYFTSNKVIKWFLDESIPKKKYEKAKLNTNIFPSNVNNIGQWLVYDYFEGDVVYKNYSVDILLNLLNWFDSKVWNKKNISLDSYCKKFYKEKTLQRVNLFLKKYPNIGNPHTVNNIPVKPYYYYLDNIDWDMLENINIPGFIHGDLQFDNIIIDSSQHFKIIDWRHEFAGLVEVGDIYYDFAKLLGGFIINYSEVKNNNFKYEYNNGHVKLTIPHIQNYEQYIKIVEDFLISKNYSVKKTKLLVPIIFWNMAPLHTPDFDLLLWYLGIKLFEEQ